MTSQKILLFDIDGTLIHAVRRPEYRSLINQLLTDIFGTCGRISEVDFGGRTDLSIYREALECEGFTIAEIRQQLPLIEAQMVNILQRLAETGIVYKLCAGVRELLDRVASHNQFLPSLLTGNVEKLAEAKLRHVDIWHYFKGRGAFGSDAEDRNHLPAIAAARLRDHIGTELQPEQFIIIGDTPRDISCAKYFGAKVLAVATGKHALDELLTYQPDAALADFSEVSKVLALLEQL